MPNGCRATEDAQALSVPTTEMHMLDEEQDGQPVALPSLVAQPRGILDGISCSSTTPTPVITNPDRVETVETRAAVADNRDTALPRSSRRRRSSWLAVDYCYFCCRSERCLPGRRSEVRTKKPSASNAAFPAAATEGQALTGMPTATSPALAASIDPAPTETEIPAPDSVTDSAAANTDTYHFTSVSLHNAVHTGNYSSRRTNGCRSGHDRRARLRRRIGSAERSN